MTTLATSPIRLHSDAELTRAAVSGDKRAFAMIYDRYSNRLYDFCVGMLANRDSAADCAPPPVAPPSPSAPAQAPPPTGEPSLRLPGPSTRPPMSFRPSAVSPAPPPPTGGGGDNDGDGRSPGGGDGSAPTPG